MGVPLTDVRESLNVALYGDGGTGKTTSACHMAHGGKILVINAEKGLKARALARNGVPIENIEVYDGEVTYKGLLAEWKRLHTALAKDPQAYAGVVWDSLTEIHKALLEEVVEQAKAKAAREGKERPTEHFIDRSEYGTMTEAVRKLVRKYRDLPCHFAITVLERRDVDEQDGKVVYRPAVTPGLINDIYGWFDIVCHTTVERYGVDQYCGLFRPEGKYRGKDRYKSMPRVLVNPTFDRIIKYVDEELSVKTDKVMTEAQKVRKSFAEKNNTKSED